MDEDSINTKKIPKAYYNYLNVFSKASFIALSHAPFASLVLFALKPRGGLQFCINFHKLNAITRKDRYLLPLINEILKQISQAKAFYQIRMDLELKELTIFRIYYSIYKCKHYINDVLFNYLDNFYTTYLNNILIYSDNPLEHKV
ncbi:hypothetical protein LCER1_G006692 [Lachnellula cervina]|uniref:Uncharacterized protein n=1 Tax=Lachnellula cervina TaxID=1316786 RepID=A0A7D8YLR9_9HELO|nr:hypothetical protein LCER1_G006692 [Lachnellula cervina]